MIWYTLLVAAIAAERLAELTVARRNTRWSMAHGGVETGRGHYPALVVLHTGLLVGCLVEARVAARPFLPGVGWPMLALVVAAQGLRWWCIGTLGRQWNTRVIVVPDLPRVTKGPYRLLRHPNYLAVVVEGAALPLVHGAWLTATAFTVCNAGLLAVRVRCEEAALSAAERQAHPPDERHVARQRAAGRASPR
ncbi:isoprenylcysteine carboxyl methyltransferase family protein [Streptomyces sp. NPDC093984]|uniref:isoprenylcysteine carboxyl methyltransferase family protein n=1 Tax=Streptomyces sp. NPDC093984 TaxID=3366052 RepID=UPI0038101A30